MYRILSSLALTLTLASTPFAVHAQTAPSAAQIAQYTGLFAAVHSGDTAKLKSLLAKPIQINKRDSQQRTALHIATFARQHEAIKLLAMAGADMNTLEYQLYDAVTIASVANDEETLALLLKLGASAKNITSMYDGTALIASAHLGHAGVVKQLIDAGAPLDHINNLHWTALIEAVVLGDGGPRHTECVRLLLQAGANKNLTDASGNTALQLAKARGYKNMVNLLTANK